MTTQALVEAGVTLTDYFTGRRCNSDCYVTDLGLMQRESKTETPLLVVCTLIQCEQTA